MKKVFVTGGAGYVGAVLVPKLLDKNYLVTVLDLMIYGENVLPKHHNLKKIKGDIRDKALLKNILKDQDAVIHLACISNDPSFELNPDLGKSINYDAFEPMVKISKDNGVKRFIYASSSSVYGIKAEPNVTEDMTLDPLTDYSKYKALCEEILLKYTDNHFTTVTLRPATVCGYSPRLRLDLTVNILTNHAINKSKILVFGGEQKRPNIHIDDISNLYCDLLELPEAKINGKIFNAGYENHKIIEIAEIVQKIIGHHVQIIKTSTDDNRSYHISSEKIKEELNFNPIYSIENAVMDLKEAFADGLIPNPMNEKKYYNVKLMKEINLK